MSRSYATEILRCHIYAVSPTVGNNIVTSINKLHTTSTAYTFDKLEKREETIRGKTKTKTKKREKKENDEKKKKMKKQTVVPAPFRRDGRHSKKRELGKKEERTKTPLIVNREDKKNKGKMTSKLKKTGRSKP